MFPHSLAHKYLPFARYGFGQGRWAALDSLARMAKVIPSLSVPRKERASERQAISQ
jgi:hypothetical protein